MRVNGMDTSTWLRGLGLERYEQAFRENEIDEAILPKLTAEDLRDLGVTAVGHRRILLDAIAALRAETFRDTTEHSVVSRKVSARNAVIASRRIRRWPIAVTPRSLRSSAVSLGRVASSIAFSRNACS